jgi:hypothetical protein
MNLVILSNDQFVGPKTLANSLKFLALSLNYKVFREQI